MNKTNERNINEWNESQVFNVESDCSPAQEGEFYEARLVCRTHATSCSIVRPKGRTIEDKSLRKISDKKTWHE